MIILCADDYALTEGVSRAIGELAAARRLSATSVLVTSPGWPSTAPRLLAHRSHLSVGLHLDLTLGTPCGPMPRLAPGGAFPALGALVVRALLGLLDPTEIKAEIVRQLDRFEQGLGFAPDHIDGHQHVHVLPGVRQVLLEAVSTRYPRPGPMIRDPSDRLRIIAARGAAASKAAVVTMLALGFRSAARRRGLITNEGFSGFSRFDMDEPYATELEKALMEPGPRHIVMCHPGHADGELARLDAVVDRRRMEYDALMRDTSLPERIWRPSRGSGGPVVDWSQV